MGLSLTEDIKSVSEFKKQIREVFTWPSGSSQVS